MNDDRPRNLTEYNIWLNKRHNVTVTSRMDTYYNAVASKALSDFRRSSFWQCLTSDIEAINQEYYLNTSYYLLVANNSFPDLYTKPFDSFLLKTFRNNIVENDKWPDPPDGGWLLPQNWFSRINDMVRTCFVVKYLDGVGFFAAQLSKRCKDLGHKCRVDYEAKEEGYYAAHFYIYFPCDIPREDWDTQQEVLSIEIQITTQLQEVIRRLLHKYYEQHRAQHPTTDVKWQWDYKSDEFAANYLGHILHYVEGMIMDMRDKKSGKEATDDRAVVQIP